MTEDAACVRARDRWRLWRLGAASSERMTELTESASQGSFAVALSGVREDVGGGDTLVLDRGVRVHGRRDDALMGVRSGSGVRWWGKGKRRGFARWRGHFVELVVSVGVRSMLKCCTCSSGAAVDLLPSQLQVAL